MSGTPNQPNVSFSGGTFSGPMAFGTRSKASQTVHQHPGADAAPAADPVLAELTEALSALREALARHRLDPETAEVADTALGDVETEVSGAVDEGATPRRGRINTALLALAGAVGGVATLGESVQRLRDAVGGWLGTG